MNTYLPNTHFGNLRLIGRNVDSPAGQIIMVHIPYSLHARARTHTHTHTCIHQCVQAIFAREGHMKTRPAIYLYGNVEALPLTIVVEEKQ